MYRGYHMRSQVLVDILLDPSYIVTQILEDFGRDMEDQDIELEEYTPLNQSIRVHFPAFLTQWVQIFLLY